MAQDRRYSNYNDRSRQSYYEKQKRPLSEKKRKKQEMIRELNEGFRRVKEARSPDEFYLWQNKVEVIAQRLKTLEFSDFK